MTALTRRRFTTGGALALAGAVLGAPKRAPAQAAPASVGPPDPALVEDLVAANRILADQNVLDGYGHARPPHRGAHARPRRGDRRPITPGRGVPQRLPRDEREAPGAGHGPGRARALPRGGGSAPCGGLGRRDARAALGALEAHGAGQVRRTP